MEKRSFLGAGGDSAGCRAAVEGALARGGWVSWPVEGAFWLPVPGVPGVPCVWVLNSWMSVGDRCVLPWHALVSALVMTTLSSPSKWL